MSLKSNKTEALKLCNKSASMNELVVQDKPRVLINNYQEPRCGDLPNLTTTDMYKMKKFFKQKTKKNHYPDYLCTTTISSILHIPCMMLELIYQTVNYSLYLLKVKLFHAPTKDKIFFSAYRTCESEKLEIISSSSFWKPCDLSGLEIDGLQYKVKIRQTLKQWKTNQDISKWQEFEQEMIRNIANDFTGRTQSCADVLEELDILCDPSVIAMTEKLYNIAYLHNKTDLFKVQTSSGIYFLHNSILGCLFNKNNSWPLHLAIANRNRELLRCIMENLTKDQQYSLANQVSKYSKYKAVFPHTQLPLNLAVWIGDIDIVKDLISYGAEMCTQDGQGYNPFHVAALLAEDNTKLSCVMHDTLIDSLPKWIACTQECSLLREMCPFPQKITCMNIMFKAETKRCKLTPLKLAAKIGSPQLFHKIMSLDGVYKMPHTKFGYKSTAEYDMSEIDTLLQQDDKPSVLELAVLRYDDDALACLGDPIFTSITEIKSACYAGYFLICSALHVSMMIFVTVGMFRIFLPKVSPLSVNPNISDHISNVNDSSRAVNEERFSMMAIDYVLLIFTIGYLFYIKLCISAIHRICARCHMTFMNLLWLYNTLQLQSNIIFCIASVCYFILKLIRSEFDIMALVVAMLSGWIHMLLFTRAFDMTAFFSIMLTKILLQDIMKFLFVIGIITLSFSISTEILFIAEGQPSRGVWDIFFKFVRLSTGISDFVPLIDSSDSKMGPGIYIAFVLLCNVLLFNMLIASMSDSYARISGNSDIYCRRVRLADMILLECIVPPCIKRKSKNMYKHVKVEIKHNNEHQGQYMDSPHNNGTGGETLFTQHMYLLQCPERHISFVK